MPLPPPINFPAFLRTQSHLLQPPVNNYCLYNTQDFTVMVVGGPNKRTDYHVNPTEEWFYQVKGAMVLKVVEKGDGGEEVFRDVEIGEGDMFMLPGNTPHNPVRFEKTVGIVIERKRPEGTNDTLQWYCETCKSIVYSESFYCTDLGTQLKPVIERYFATEELRTCKKCGHVNQTK
ncbi:3-hydroxyanthranilic acid dioxygenase [Fimicolochytrium jonesii]|uniref:3-hydroxyanthranilic acid dioxygenase n=1 Tax=Fimicolochytrium jonesii TaxID=1396493 RepID=UPI0022FDE322|nr:3-hydroxyanthranilic acid dioxygenase [Fimicolochytrium jonesii]KAI8821435.1 3-hydroxyanthranilic acid dioxygenase [Fimicolochytrium jonesii]